MDTVNRLSDAQQPFLYFADYGLLANVLFHDANSKRKRIFTDRTLEIDFDLYLGGR